MFLSWSSESTIRELLVLRKAREGSDAFERNLIHAGSTWEVDWLCSLLCNFNKVYAGVQLLPDVRRWWGTGMPGLLQSRGRKELHTAWLLNSNIGGFVQDTEWAWNPEWRTGWLSLSMLSCYLRAGSEAPVSSLGPRAGKSWSWGSFICVTRLWPLDAIF